MNYSVEILQKAKEIHNRVLVLDTHIDINTDYFTSTKNYLHELDIQVTLPKMKEGGMDVAWLIVYTAQEALTSDGFEQAYNNAIRKFIIIKIKTRLEELICEKKNINKTKINLTIDAIS